MKGEGPGRTRSERVEELLSMNLEKTGTALGEKVTESMDKDSEKDVDAVELNEDPSEEITEDNTQRYHFYIDIADIHKKLDIQSFTPEVPQHTNQKEKSIQVHIPMIDQHLSIQDTRILRMFRFFERL